MFPTLLSSTLKRIGRIPKSRVTQFSKTSKRTYAAPVSEMNFKDYSIDKSKIASLAPEAKAEFNQLFENLGLNPSLSFEQKLQESVKVMTLFEQFTHVTSTALTVAPLIEIYREVALQDQVEDFLYSMKLYTYDLQNDTDLVDAWYDLLVEEEIGEEREAEVKQIIDESLANIHKLASHAILKLVNEFGYQAIEDIESAQIINQLLKISNREDEKPVRATFTNAYELTEHEQDFYYTLLEQSFPGKTLYVDFEVDPTVGSGYVLDVDGKEFDLSWKHASILV